ncbi:phage holin family protein [Paraliomyxa miuraensis]|uniref:phage holin family protein n=1 Tax=Paraliomyxa miuraensis TaxID=376150 RepID=UPI0022583B18|nr:phage holin family protein [Paraliomyxa miuraensis]MCX4244619.1 phage holin family protein [Paraliomyxa miuraensis]
MGSFVASVLGFALGLLLLPAMIRGVRIKGTGSALRAGLVCGILSVVLGKLLVALLTLVFLLPIVLTGPFGVFAVQAFVNAILLGLTARIVDGLEFERTRSVLWAAVALTALQTIARLLL